MDSCTGVSAKQRGETARPRLRSGRRPEGGQNLRAPLCPLVVVEPMLSFLPPMHLDSDSVSGGLDPEADLLDAGPPDRPASDSQLLRLGRLLGLRYGEAETLLEALAETEPPAEPPAPRLRALRERLAE